jgi:inner membrane transporter RhtA
MTLLFKLEQLPSRITSVNDLPGTATSPGARRRFGRRVLALPPVSYFGFSAVFHYLGPSLAVLLFARVPVLGVAWLRIASAAVVFALWRRPWRVFASITARERVVLIGLGVVLAVMNALFYLAIARLPLSTVGAIEFLGVVVLAAAGARTRRNVAAVAVAVAGVAVLTEVRLGGEPLGFVYAFGNCAGFMLYVLLGHRVANTKVGDGGPLDGIDRLGVAMVVAIVVSTPFGLSNALVAFDHPWWLVWGVGVGVCSSVIPYVTDQLAMARLSRSTFALMLSLLPAAATLIGLAVLHQVPTPRDVGGVGLVIAGLLIHQDVDGAADRDVDRSRPTANAAYE